MPDPSLSIDDGALVPWSVGGSSGFYEAVIQAIADRYEIDTSKPWSELTEAEQEPLPQRHRRREDLRPVPQPHGAAAPVHARLRRHRREPPAPLQGDRLVAAARADRGVHVAASVPGLQGRAPQAGGARGHRRRPLDPRVHPDVGRAGARLPRRARPDADRGADRAPDREGDPRAAHVPRRRRSRLPHARPRGGDALRRRGAAAAARDADRLAARRRPLHPRRAVDRPPPARQRAPDRHARAAARHRQHRARRRARRGDDAPLRLARRHGAGRRPARRRGRRRRAGGEGRAEQEVGHGAVPLGRARDRGARAARRGSRLVPRHAAPRSTTSRTSTSSSRSASSSA